MMLVYTSYIIHMPEQTMKTLMSKNPTTKEWLRYYRNIWVRNAVARAIDVQNDENAYAIKPDAFVIEEDAMGQQHNVPILKRLEMRKLGVQDALDVVKACDVMLAVPEAEFFDRFFSEKALAVKEETVAAATGADAKEKTAEVAPEVAAEKAEEVTPTATEENVAPVEGEDDGTNNTSEEAKV